MDNLRQYFGNFRALYNTALNLDTIMTQPQNELPHVFHCGWILRKTAKKRAAFTQPLSSCSRFQYVFECIGARLGMIQASSAMSP